MDLRGLPWPMGRALEGTMCSSSSGYSLLWPTPLTTALTTPQVSVLCPSSLYLCLSLSASHELLELIFMV
jgi:hypothetical protein